MCPARAWVDTGGVPLGDDEAEHSTGSQHRSDGPQGVGGILDHLEHLVTDDQVSVSGADQVEEIAGVTLHSRDGPRQALLGRPTLEGGESVGTGVDDSDLVSSCTQAHGHPPGAAAEVDHSTAWMSRRPVRETGPRAARSDTSGTRIDGDAGPALHPPRCRFPSTGLSREAIQTPTVTLPHHRGIGSPGADGGRVPSAPGRARHAAANATWVRIGTTRSSPSTGSKSCSNQDSYKPPPTPRQASQTARGVGRWCGRFTQSDGQSPQPIGNTSNDAAMGTPSRVPVGRAPPSRNSRGSKYSQPRPSM